ncbi:hypothetical protein E2320_019539 [Naja naja]|nr:hypothetical protein E2320_019539 [Naja naja]
MTLFPLKFLKQHCGTSVLTAFFTFIGNTTHILED